MQEVHCRVGWKWKTSSFVTVTLSGRVDAKEAAGAGVFTDTMGPLWLVQPAMSTAASTTRARAMAGPVRAMGNRSCMMITSMSAQGVGVAGAAPICGAEIGLVLRSAILAEVHDAVAGVHGLRERGAGGSAETALHL